ncbi:CTD kinase subunit alpha [Physcia stellaris]|nr:CTD kinase subunit alpha [Physcia stellaris]
MSANESSDKAETSRRVLGNISNRGGRTPSSQQGEKDRNSPNPSTPVARNNVKTQSKSSASIRHRQFSKPYGDLSQLRPVSPPLNTAVLHRDHPVLSPGKYVEDMPSKFSEGDPGQRASNTLDNDQKERDTSITNAQPLASQSVAFQPVLANACKHDYEIRPLPPLPAEVTAAMGDLEDNLHQRSSDTARPFYRCEGVSSPQSSSVYNSKLRKHHYRPVRIQNLGHDEWCHPADIFLPIEITYPPLSGQDLSEVQGLGYIHVAPPIDHLGTCTTWKGLTLIDAEQLLRIHQTFRITVNYLLAGQVADLIQGYSSTSWSTAHADFDSSDLIHRRRCHLSWKQLLMTMKISLGYYEKQEETRFRFIDLLYLYLSTVDCFQFDEDNGSDSDSISFILKYCETNTAPLLQPVVEATWLPDYLSIRSVELYPREGEQLVIVPVYQNHADCGLSRWQDAIRYSLRTNLPWLKWDHTVSGWKGIIPRFSEIRDSKDQRYGSVCRTNRAGRHAIVNLLRIDIVAFRAEVSVSGIRVERTIRARLTIKVRPCWATDRVLSNVSQPHSTHPNKGEVIKSLSKKDTTDLRTGSPLCNTPGEQVASVVQGRITPSMNHWSSRAHQFEKEVMSKVRTEEDKLVAKYLDGDSRQSHSSRVETITEILERYGLSGKAKTEMDLNTDIQAYPVTMPRVMQHHPSHMFDNPYATVRRNRGSACSSGSARSSTTGQSHRSPSTSVFLGRYTSFLSRMQASVSATRRMRGDSTHQDPSSPIAEQARGSSLEILQRLPPRHITPQSTARTASEYSFGDRERRIQPASAELFAIAQTLHHQPQTRKRVRGTSFEQSPMKRTREECEETATTVVDSGYRSDSASMSAYPSPPVTSALDEGDDRSTAATSLVTTRTRLDVLTSRVSSGFTDSKEATESCDTSRVSSNYNPYSDPQIQHEQGFMRDAIREIEAEGPVSLQERKDLYEALKRSMQDSERLSHERLGIHLSQDFTDSEATDNDFSSNFGTDFQELGKIAENNHEGTESCQSSISRRVPSHNETYVRCLASGTHSALNVRDFELDTDSEYQSDSSDFVDDPSHESDSSPPGPKEHEDQKRAESALKAREDRPTPLMGFFGAGPAARGRLGPVRGPRSRGVQRRGPLPKCFGCEVRDQGIGLGMGRLRAVLRGKD